MKRIVYIIPVLVFTLLSCSDDVDTTKPDITLIKPTEDAGFHPGDKIEFICDFSDNDELASYKVEIHNNFDGHDHDHTGSASMKSATEEEDGHAWSYEKTWSFDKGTSAIQINHQEIEIPLTILHDEEQEAVAEGHYHVGVYCIDAAGNERSVFTEIEIEHMAK